MKVGSQILQAVADKAKFGDGHLEKEELLEIHNGKGTRVLKHLDSLLNLFAVEDQTLKIVGNADVERILMDIAAIVTSDSVAHRRELSQDRLRRT